MKWIKAKGATVVTILGDGTTFFSVCPNIDEVRRMTREDQILIQILATFTNGRSIGVLQDISLEALYQAAQKHNVGGIVSSMLQPVLKTRAEDPAARKFREIYMATIFRSVQLEEEVKMFADRMEQAGIPYAFFKGYELRELYPDPELRTMGDVDVLVRDEDMEKTIRVLNGLGYTKEGEGSAVWTCTNGTLSYEIHRRLAFGKYWNQVDHESYFAKAFDRLQDKPGPRRGGSGAVNGTVSGKSRRYFSLEDHFIFLCFHLAKHLNSTGAGIRMVMDIALYLKAYQEQMDWKYIWEECRKIRLDVFVKTLLQVCREWFQVPSGAEAGKTEAAGNAPDKEVLGQLAAYIMTGGVFGFERDDSIRRLRKGIDARTDRMSVLIRAKALWKIAFPQRKHMAYFMPAVERHPALLPLAWIRRWMRGLRERQRLEAAFHGLDKGQYVDEAREQYRLLKKIGL